MAITEKIRGIVDFLTQGLEQQEDGDDVFTDIMNEAGQDDYETEDNLALAPAYQQKREKADLRVLPNPNMRGTEVMIIEPRSFGEAGQIVQNLRDRKTIVLNLHLLDKEQSQRTIDFVCGAASALNGQPQKVGDMVFVFTPNNVTLTVDAAKTQTALSENIWSGRTL